MDSFTEQLRFANNGKRFWGVGVVIPDQSVAATEFKAYTLTRFGHLNSVGLKSVKAHSVTRAAIAYAEQAYQNKVSNSDYEEGAPDLQDSVRMLTFQECQEQETLQLERIGKAREARVRKAAERESTPKQVKVSKRQAKADAARTQFYGVDPEDNSKFWGVQVVPSGEALTTVVVTFKGQRGVSAGVEFRMFEEVNTAKLHVEAVIKRKESQFEERAAPPEFTDGVVSQFQGALLQLAEQQVTVDSQVQHGTEEHSEHNDTDEIISDAPAAMAMSLPPPEKPQALRVAEIRTRLTELGIEDLTGKKADLRQRLAEVESAASSISDGE